ncbi:related to putative acetamidase [Pseudozyma flocculosa]|uniref:amidase n=1 Tax=Pseudozyma flocculosa TaxID=84751 RepID=A0A5C3FAH8_9BASI|nr:related to putative acetamidase [Pseudozyma flocculosa]
MSVQPDYHGCADWRAIADLHQTTLAIPEHLISSDPALQQWRLRANQDLEPPSARSQHGKDATSLVGLMKSGAVKVEDVTRSFLARAAVVHQATGCLSHFFHDLALHRARLLDAKRAELDRLGRLDQLGACFGLPISIKGHLHYAGKGSQRGFVFDVLPDPTAHPLVRSNLTQEQVAYLAATQGGFINDPPADSHLVSLLLDADVVILAKTAMPQGVMHLDTRSNLYGQTLNPWNLALSPGGSSGGESALVAGGGTALGVGSDIGGSVRQPSGVCNLYGLRPTTLRLPYNGRTRPWAQEHNLFPIPWRRVDGLLEPSADAPPRTIVVGVMLEDGVVRPTAPVRRAMTTWLSRLQSASAQARMPTRFELKLYKPGTLHRRSWDLIRSLYFMDSGKLFHLLAKATGEPLLPLTQFILQPDFVRAAQNDLAADAAGDSTRKRDEMSATEVWAMVREREALRKESLRLWNQLGLDCLLCPVMGSVAPRPGKIKYWGYTSAFNLVDYPGIAFPSGLVADSAKDREYEASESAAAQPGQGAEAWRYDAWRSDLGEFDRENREEYEAHRGVFDGAPIGLQLIGRRYQDEELCKYLELLEHAYRRG